MSARYECPKHTVDFDPNHGCPECTRDDAKKSHKMQRRIAKALESIALSLELIVDHLTGDDDDDD
jgi:hypothetical protein